MALYLKGKVPTTYAVVGLGYGGRACAYPPPARNASQREFPNSGTRKRAGAKRTKFYLIIKFGF